MASKVVKRSYKYRFYPSQDQAAQLSRTFGCVRFVWNKALDRRTKAYAMEGRGLNYSQASAELTEWKRTDEMAFLKEVAAVPLQQVLRHQQAAFSNFYSKRTRYPKFKSRKRSKGSASYTRAGFVWRDGELTLAKMSAPLNIRWSRPLPLGAEPSTVTVSCDSAGRWHVSILVETPVHTLPVAIAATVGVDVGITSLVALSSGEKVANPRHERVDRRRLVKAQRALSRKEKGSQNRQKARRKVARAYARIADRRTDFLHKLSTRLIHENQVIAIEDLAVRDMLANKHLAPAISDASWRQLRTMLEYKANWYGRDLLVVDRWYPSTRLCSECGKLHEQLPLSSRSWTCERCGSNHDRDVNAARNILAAGLAERRNARGADVSP